MFVNFCEGDYWIKNAWGEWNPSGVSLSVRTNRSLVRPNQTKLFSEETREGISLTRSPRSRPPPLVCPQETK
jgi:hypothetical protein